MFLLFGCRGETSRRTDDAGTSAQAPAPSASRAPLQLLVVDDPDLAQITQREWQAYSGQILSVQQQTASQLREDLAVLKRIDAVIGPSTLLPELVESGLIEAMPDHVWNHAEWNRSDLLLHVRGPEISWGTRPWGVSFGSPQFMLIYRADVLADWGRRPPQTWDEYAQLVQDYPQAMALRKEHATDQPAWPAWPTVEPLAEGWASYLLLARAAPYVTHRSQYSNLFDVGTMRPLVDQPPFTRALNELHRVMQTGGGTVSPTLTPTGAAEQVVTGACLMAIGWPSHKSPSNDSPREIGFAPLPGAAAAYVFPSQRWEDRLEDDNPGVPLLGIPGRIGMVSSSSHRKRSAWNLLMWLTGPQFGTTIASASPATGPFRESQQTQLTSWLGTTYQASASRYFQIVRENSAATSWQMAPRFLNTNRYLSDLDQAVRQVVAGQAPPQAALENVAQSWRNLTESIGLPQQQAAYLRSLGLEEMK